MNFFTTVENVDKSSRVDLLYNVEHLSKNLVVLHLQLALMRNSSHACFCSQEFENLECKALFYYCCKNILLLFFLNK